MTSQISQILSLSNLIFVLRHDIQSYLSYFCLKFQAIFVSYFFQTSFDIDSLKNSVKNVAALVKAPLDLANCQKS